MSKKITINKIISYTLSCSNKDNTRNNYDVIAKIPNTLEKLSFRILKYKDSRDIGDFPEHIKGIFNPFINDIKRYGVIKYKNNKNKDNISLFYSILFCINVNFAQMEQHEKESKIYEFRNKILKDIYGKDLYKKYKYKNIGWSMDDIRYLLKNFKNDWKMLRLLSDFLNINIFLLDIGLDSIYSIYSEEKFNKFKENVFIVCYNEVFEPLVYLDNKLWNLNMKPFKKLINVNSSLITSHSADYSQPLLKVGGKASGPMKKKFQIDTEDLEIYLKKYNLIDNNNNNNKDSLKDDNFEEVGAESEVYHDKIKEKSEKNISITLPNNAKDIFHKRNNTDNSSDSDDSSDSDSDDSSESKPKHKPKTKNKSRTKHKTNRKSVDYSDIESINMRMKLKEIQNIAKKYGITIENGRSKNGRMKYKTKSSLHTEMLELIK